MRASSIWVVSSAVEHCLHTAGVTSSNLVPPTKYETRMSQGFAGFLLPSQYVNDKLSVGFVNWIVNF
jgi:hypothetical protein